MRRQTNDFWRHSLQVYRRPAVQAACLALQDRCGADVNILLWCCWLGQRGRALDQRELRRAMAAAAPWQEGVLRPLRQARRAVRSASLALPSARTEALRQRLLAIELDAEHLEHRLLFELAQALPARVRRPPPDAATLASLTRYAALLGAGTPATASAEPLLRALADAATGAV